MAIPLSEFPENPLNLKNLNKIPKNQKVEKVKKSNPNLKSLWAFLSSILIYIYVFYIFNLSPSALICSTKFWFLISNTLVLIVAVDFAAFSQHEGHVLKSKCATNELNEHVAEDTTATSPIIMVNDTTATSSSRVKEEENSPKEKIINAVNDHPQKKRQTCSRSNLEEERKAMVLHRTFSEGDDHHGLLEDEKSNEFSRMSNEEVNRRVEEFIRRFNRQIRLQAVINRQNLVN